MAQKDDKNTPKIVQNFNIGSVGQLNPMATTIVNNYYGDEQKKKTEETPVDKGAIRKQIIAYVSKTLPLVTDEWRNRYMKLWEDILNIPEVDADVYIKGKRVGTTFNRTMVVNIIHYLGNYLGKKKGVFRRWEAKETAICLEGTWECSARNELGDNPSSAIQKAILKLINSPQYK